MENRVTYDLWMVVLARACTIPATVVDWLFIEMIAHYQRQFADCVGVGSTENTEFHSFNSNVRFILQHETMNSANKNE